MAMALQTGPSCGTTSRTLLRFLFLLLLCSAPMTTLAMTTKNIVVVGAGIQGKSMRIQLVARTHVQLLYYLRGEMYVLTENHSD